MHAKNLLLLRQIRQLITRLGNLTKTVPEIPKMTKKYLVITFLSVAGAILAGCVRIVGKVEIESCISSHVQKSSEVFAPKDDQHYERISFSIIGDNVENFLPKNDGRLRYAIADSCFPDFRVDEPSAALYSPEDARIFANLDRSPAGTVVAVFFSSDFDNKHIRLGGTCLQLFDTIPWEGGFVSNRVKINRRLCARQS